MAGHGHHDVRQIMKPISQFPDTWHARHSELGQQALDAVIEAHTDVDRYFARRPAVTE